MPEQQTNHWYHTLTDSVNTLAEEFGLNDTQTNHFRDFAIKTAKEQWKSGSRSGAAWAFKQAREGIKPGVRTQTVA